jgi:hypothetical protein
VRKTLLISSLRRWLMVNRYVNPARRAEFRLLGNGAFLAFGRPVTKPSGDGGCNEYDANV